MINKLTLDESGGCCCSTQNAEIRSFCAPVNVTRDRRELPLDGFRKRLTVFVKRLYSAGSLVVSVVAMDGNKCIHIRPVGDISAGRQREVGVRIPRHYDGAEIVLQDGFHGSRNRQIYVFFLEPRSAIYRTRITTAMPSINAH